MLFMGKMQLIVQELDRVEESSIELADFLPVSRRSVVEMVDELSVLVEALTDPDLKRLMRAFLADEAFMTGYMRAPAAKAMHHVYLGGLLEHSLAVAALANDISQRYTEINRDLLVVGALLHDVGKVVGVGVCVVVGVCAIVVANVVVVVGGVVVVVCVLVWL